jgi:hypothetical protein
VLAGGWDRLSVNVTAVERPGHRDACRLGDLHHDVGLDRDRRALLDCRWHGAAQFAAVGKEQSEQCQRGDRYRGELQPVLEGLHERDGAHPARDDIGDDDPADYQRPDPNRHAEKRFQRQAGALILRHQIEHADHYDDEHRDLAQPCRAEPELREVRHRVRTRPAQRCGDEQQQPQIAGGEADRIPQRIGAVFGDQPGDTEKRSGREVFPRDRGGVPFRPDTARGDQEVGCGAGEANPVCADRDGRHRRREQRGRCQRGAGHGSLSTTPTKSRSACSASRTYSRPTP